MAITSGFFNSVNGDRRYKADFFAEYFASFISNGVFPNPSTGMQVIANGNMTVSIRAGKAWIKGYYVNNDADYKLSLDVADGVLKRIDRIVLRLDYSSRQITPAVKKGTPASSPTAPVLQRDADAYELDLADISITNGAISITQSNITDQRLNTSLCGIVHGTVDQVDTTTIYNQYQTWFNETKTSATSRLNTFETEQEAEFTAWFDSVKGMLEGDVAANLSSQIQSVSQDLAAHKADDTSHVRYGTASGTNAKTIRLDPIPTALVEGMALSFKNTTANTGAVTLNVNSFGAKPVIKSNGNALSSGNLRAGSIYTVRYDGTSFILQGEGASGNAVASDLLSGKTAGSDAGDLVGTMPNKVGSGTAIKPGTSDIVIPKGYFGGVLADGRVLGDSALIAANIKTGASIFGIAGNVTPLAGEKQWATGIAKSSSSSWVFTDSNSNVLNYPRVSVTGLAFSPKTILIMSTEGKVDASISKEAGMYYGYYQIAFISSGRHIRLIDAASITASGFYLPVPDYTRDYRWLAIE